MDRETVEDVVHASLGRHLRVTCVLGLLFLVVGFVLGHFVAAQHSRELADRWALRADKLADQVDAIEQRLEAELAQTHQMDEASLSSQQAEVAQLSRHEEMLNETRRLARATEDLRRSLIARCIEENEREKARILQELQPYLDRKMTIKAAEVSEALNRLVDTQVAQLKTLAQVEITTVASSGSSLPMKSEISPVSAESDSARCPAPSHSALVPIAEVPTPAEQENVALMPMPRTPIIRMPVQAEPSSTTQTEQGGSNQFFTAPRKPRLFIPARKPLEVSSAAEPVVR